MFSLSNFWEFDAPLMNQKPGKANFRELVSKKIPGGACPRAPLEACSLGPSFRKSVSIYPRSATDYLGKSWNDSQEKRFYVLKSQLGFVFALPLLSKRRRII